MALNRVASSQSWLVVGVMHRASSALTFGFPASALPARSRVLLSRYFSLDAFEHIGFRRSESRYQLSIVAQRR